jgi:hypothetical protein
MSSSVFFRIERYPDPTWLGHASKSLETSRLYRMVKGLGSSNPLVSANESLRTDAW